MRTEVSEVKEKRFNIDEGVWKVSSLQPIEYMVVEKNNFFVDSPYEETIFGPKATNGTTRRLIVIDYKVAEHFGDLISNYFFRNDVETEILILSVEEEAKGMATVLTVLDKIIEMKLQRRSEPIIAIGGGVLLDIVGFAASLHRRGMPYVRVPTTLVGLIDAGIGVKTGVNYNSHKNRIGTYHPPFAALLDPSFLSTLDERHIKNGMGEILKMALIKEEPLFRLLEKSAHEIISRKLYKHEHAQAIMRLSIHSMLEELQKNLWEEELERLVDFGHSFGPTLEMRVLPAILHGESVALDMAICVAIAYSRSLLSGEELERILTVYQALDLPIYHSICQPPILIEALRDTISHRDGKQRIPLPYGIGNGVFVNDISKEEIEQAAALLRRRVDFNA